jgi:Replication protein
MHASSPRPTTSGSQPGNTNAQWSRSTPAPLRTLESPSPRSVPAYSLTPSQSLKLETRGLTEQQAQAQLWPSAIIHANTIAAKLRETGRATEARTLEDCHTQWTISICNSCNLVQKFPNRCENLFCPKCQPYLSRKRRKAIEWWTREVKQPKHVVLTVQNASDLTAAHVRQFKQWFRALRRTKFAANWRGGFYSIEVTNEGRGWHLHMHALIDATWIDQFALSEHWQRATAGFGRIVKVKDAREQNYLNEVTKYAVKGSQLAAWRPDQIATFIDAFKGVRTFGVFGSLYGKRTQWRAWIETLRTHGRVCECGCSQFRYFTELQWTLMDLQPTMETRSLPPPPLHDPAQLTLGTIG